MTEIVSTLRLEVIRPLDGDWDALGSALRALRTPLHRVLNGVVTDLEVEERAGKLGKEEDGKIPARTRGYQLTRDLWLNEREAAAARVAAYKQDPKKNKIYAGDQQIATVHPGAQVINGVAGAAYARWQKWRKEKWAGKMSLPSFKKNSPIYIASSGGAVKIEEKDGLGVLRLSLFAGGDETRPVVMRLVVKPYRGSGWASLKKIFSDPDCLGDCRLIEDNHGGKRKWMAFVSFRSEVREAAQGRTMALHRGLRTFLTAAIARSDDGKEEAYTTVLADGGDILAHKAGYDARRRSLGRHRRELGAGARGHGKARREEHITRLEDAEARWVRTKCQEIAAHAMRLAEKRGVSRILVEDWTNPAKEGAPELGEYLECLVRRFPLAQLRESIEWAAKKRGYKVEIVASDGNARTCPKCRHVHTAEQSHAFGKAGVFRCEECLLERPVDMIYPWNMLVRDGKPLPLNDQIAATKRATDRIKRGSATVKKGGVKKVQPMQPPKAAV